MNIGGDIGYLLQNSWREFLWGLGGTVLLSVFGTLVGLFIGIFLAFGKNVKIDENRSKGSQWWKYVIIWICNIYSVVIRGTPMMVQAMIFKYGCQLLGVNWNLVLPGVPVFNGWMIAGLVVITLNTAAYMGEIIRSGLNGVGKDQIEGAKALGMTPFQTLFIVTLPQAIRNSIPTIGNEWIVNIKDSSVLNIIGVSELFFMTQQSANKGYKFMAAYLIVAVIYLLLTLVTTGILKLVEMKMDGKKIEFKLFSNHFKESRAN